MTLDELEELLLTLSYKEDDKKESEQAFTQLYKSYAPFVSSVIKKYLKDAGIYDGELYGVIMNNVFLKVYNKPLSFSVPEGAKDDRVFKGWLSTVAKNEFYTQLKNNDSNLILTSNIETFDSASVNEKIYQSTNITLLNKALDTLSNRDRHILMTYYLHHQTDSKTPTIVLDNLAKLHGTKRDNMRQIKLRSEKKVIAFIEKHSELKSIKNA